MRTQNANVTNFRLKRTTTPSSPASGFVLFYIKDSDGKAYVKNSSGTETVVGDAPPPTYTVIPVFSPSANVNWSTLTEAAISSVYIVSTGAQNAEIEFDVAVAPGTYTLEFLSFKGGNLGIYTLLIDDVETGTPVDGYGSDGVIHVGSFAGLSLSGTKNIKLKMATKNASSSAYYGALISLWLKKTG